MLEPSDERRLNSLHAQILTDPDGRKVLAVTPLEEFLSLIALASHGLKSVVDEISKSENVKIKKDEINGFVDKNVNEFLFMNEKFRSVYKVNANIFGKDASNRVHDLYGSLIEFLSLDIDLHEYASASENQDQDIAAYDKAKQQDEECFPEVVVNRLVAGENPTRIFRQYRGMTQKALAEKARVGQAYISQIERGIRIGSTRTLKQVANVLGVEVDDLI